MTSRCVQLALVLSWCWVAVLVVIAMSCSTWDKVLLTKPLQDCSVTLQLLKDLMRFMPKEKVLFSRPRICSGYGCMCKVARRAAVVSQVNNHHACSTVAFYLCMFVMQLLPFIYSLTSILLQEQTMSFHLSQQWSIQHVTLLVLLMLPQCINPVVYSATTWWRMHCSVSTKAGADGISKKAGASDI